MHQVKDKDHDQVADGDHFEVAVGAVADPHRAPHADEGNQQSDLEQKETRQSQAGPRRTPREHPEELLPPQGFPHEPAARLGKGKLAERPRLRPT